MSNTSERAFADAVCTKAAQFPATVASFVGDGVTLFVLTDKPQSHHLDGHPDDLIAPMAAWLAGIMAPDPQPAASGKE